MNKKRIIEVYKEKSQLIDERYDGYRSDLVETLSKIIVVQSEELSTKGRQDKTQKIIETLSDKVMSKIGLYK
jgi:hypothetical protein